MQDLPSETVIRASDPMRDRSHGGAPFLMTAEEADVGARFLTGEVAAVDGGFRQLESSRSEAKELKEAEQAQAEQRARLTAEARAAEEAERRKAARVRSEQVGRFHAAAAARAAEDAKIAAVADIRAETDEEVRIQAEKQARLQAEEDAKAAVEAKLRAEAEVVAQAHAEATKKAAELASPAPPPDQVAQGIPFISTTAKAVKKTYKKSKRLRGSIRKVWFYTCEGERLGPVAFKELRLMAADLSLNPRLDMIWTEGMEMWKPAGQVDGLFERRNVRVGSQQAVAAPIVYQQVQSPRSVMGKHASWPGARRPLFLFGSVLFPFAWHFFVKMAEPNLAKEFGQIMMAALLRFSPLVPVMLATHLGLQRLVNLGMSRWWIFAILMPILNFWLGYRCLVCPAGYAYHKKLDGAGVILAILYGSILMLAGLAVVAGIALLLDPGTCPTHWLPLREMIRNASQLFQ